MSRVPYRLRYAARLEREREREIQINNSNSLFSCLDLGGVGVGGSGWVVQWCWVNFQCWGTWIIVGQGPTALVVGAGGGCLDIFTLICPFLFSFSLSLGDGPI